MWETSQVKQIYVSRASPTSIGLFSVVGMLRPIDPDQAVGAVARLGTPGSRLKAPILPGRLKEVQVQSLDTLEPIVPWALVQQRPVVLALDGEREMVLKEGQEASVRLSLAGPWMVNVELVLEEAVANQEFRVIQG